MISAVLIVKNEAHRLRACLEALNWVDEIVALDSGSEDGTVALLKEYAAKVFTRPFDQFDLQKNHAIDQAEGDWILSIDADEIVTQELAQQLMQLASQENPEYEVYSVSRDNYFLGKPLRFGGQKMEEIIRFFRRGKARFVQPVHEYLETDGPSGRLSGCLVHKGTESLAAYLKKMRQYTSLEAAFLAEEGRRGSWLHVTVLPGVRFLYYYFFRWGILDGWRGFAFHFLSSVYYAEKYHKLMKLNKDKK